MQTPPRRRRRRYRKPPKTPWQRFSSVALRVLAILIVAGLIAWVIASGKLRVEKKSLTHGDLSEDIGQLKVVYISDFHKGYHYTDTQLDTLVSKVNALNPDLLLLGGDYSTDIDGAIDFFTHFPAFHSRYGFYAVLGEADLSDAKGERCDDAALQRLRNVMYMSGVTPLVNETATVRIGNGSLYVAGLDDARMGYPDYEGVAEQFATGDYVILLMHSPAGIEKALRAAGSDNQRRWFDLLLCGHTHGGQIPLLGQGLGISNVPDAYLSGWSEANKADILVSNGVGFSKLPLRLGAPPQIHLITVRNK